ncbi:hypothetical protein BX616_005834 [Lobosporangium transversale]|uniref:BZIP domain-containing protein n=1 Tax=Lobosporangium transversale TaxID=64571 RepID=A0A1Y2GJC8_9FUNG|nr:hypothetical protein BCR41DRAFT_356289 [Lobosporangium transversale]KAF9915576.1 hypothetical protein BX616_005834 [Lobosporangium transversale]ORZ12559.1 hypothetical protein BCR41DRAFT_356289 [Lobosporangium transversale]|eukprot:XP_021880178.1 hypothetical protein BCR41DRAFT_356289 [Lobosporangium transversale]
MTNSTFDDRTAPTTMSEAVNAVNAAIVAAVAAGEGTSTFSSRDATHDHLSSIRHIDNLSSIENLNSSAIETIVAAIPRLKRPAEDDAGNIDDSAKLRRLQEEVNNNANAAAGILSGSSNHSSNTSSTHSPSHSGTETHVAASNETEDTATVPPNAKSDPKDTSVTSTTQAQQSKSIQVTPGMHEVMADLMRMQQMVKKDPRQITSFTTNPNNQATLEQLTSLTSSALANVLAQAPLSSSDLQNSIQSQREPESQPQPQPQPQAQTQSRSQHVQESETTQGILASVPATTESASANDAAAILEDDVLNGKRTSRDMSNEERRQRRLLRNRVAAKECRKKKKAYVNELQDTCTRLQEENARLYKEIEELNAKLTLSAMRIDENVRLIKEVEQLSAKLTLGAMAHMNASVVSGSQSPSKVADGSSLEQQVEESRASTSGAQASSPASAPTSDSSLTSAPASALGPSETSIEAST